MSPGHGNWVSRDIIVAPNLLPKFHQPMNCLQCFESVILAVLCESCNDFFWAYLPVFAPGKHGFFRRNVAVVANR